jgi:hypothetical protein
METWRHETWKHGEMETWRHEDIETWKWTHGHGDMNMETWPGDRK